MSRGLTASLVLVAFAVAATAALATAAPSDVTGTVYCVPASGDKTPVAQLLRGGNNIQCTLGGWTATKWTAKANISQQINQTGWNGVFVETNPVFDDSLTAYSAGFIEGALTMTDIHLTWATNPLAPAAKVQQFVNENYEWMLQQVGGQPTDPYWQQVSLVLAQVRGLADGYNSVAGSNAQLTFDQIMWMGMTVELGDIEMKMYTEKRPDFDSMTRKEVDMYVRKNSHCSVLVKTLADFSDIYFSHDTWSSYSTMLRHFKTYKFAFKTGDTRASTVMLSGYPASIASVDDFYMNSQQLAITETTNDVFNASLFDLLTTASVPYWVRVTVASRQADSSPRWHQVFYMYNSGTYSNQWITLDYKLFVPGQPLVNNTLWISEQLPGYFRAEDQTKTLQFGHWPSYNVPFYDDIYVISGNAAMEKKEGLDYSYQLCPRAKIFRRDSDKVEDFATMKSFMLENNYGHSDPLAPDPGSAISARWDLFPAADRYLGGGIDCKVVNLALVKAMQVQAKSGPTFQGQPLFAWTGEYANQTAHPHYGQPTAFNFDFVTFQG